MHGIYRKQKYKVETQGITWKTHYGGKNHDSPQAVEYTIREEYNSGSARATTSSTSPFATRGGYKMEATTSLSLSPSLCTCAIQPLYKYVTTTTTFYALSHIYTYMTFRHIYICVLPIGRNRSEPVLRSIGSLYLRSGGTCYPT